MNNIREYKSGLKNFPDAEYLMVTSTVQGEYGAAVQLTIGGHYIVLAENQVIDLIKVLDKRLKFASGYSATDTIRPRLIKPAKVKK